jgi:hypothetical protein
MRKVIHTVLAIVAQDPTERSMPFTVSAKVIPIATIVTIQTARRIVVRFEIVRKVGMVIANPIMSNAMVSRMPHFVMKSSIADDLNVLLAISIASGRIIE